MKTFSIVLTFLIAGSFNGFAEEYRGADAVLKSVAAASEKPIAVAEDIDSPAKLKHDLKTFREKADKMPPADAAKEWLQFVDRFVNLRVDRESISWMSSTTTDLESNQITFQQILAALPPPSSWEALAQAVDARTPDKNDASRTVLLRVMAHWLLGKNDVAKKDLESLQQQANHQSYDSYSVNELQWGLIQNSDDGAAILASLNQRLQKDAKSDFGMRLQLPDLVSLVGEEKATAFLREALRTEKGEISIVRGDATQKLARKLALEMVNDLKAAQWGLASSLEATALYEAMAKRFSVSDRDRYGRQNAQCYYLLGLIAAHRAPEAAAFATTLGDQATRSLPDEALSTLERAGYTRDLAQFFHDLLEKNPDLPFWNEYVALAAKAQETDKMVALAEASAARTGLNSKQRRTILNQLHHAYLAADKIDKGLEILRQEMALEKSDKIRAESSDDVWYRGEGDDAALSLISLGAVLAQPELINEGVRAVREAPVTWVEAREKEKRANRLNKLGAQLLSLKRGREAEDVLTDALIVAPEPAKQQYSSPSQPGTLGLLLALYHRASRPEDILSLLTRAPQWYSRDLANIFAQDVSIGRQTDSVGLFAADALLRTGRAAEAQKVVDVLVERHSGYDPGYELLVKLEGKNAITHLDRLFARDQFEERPLIWKTKVLFDAGKMEEAEKCVRQAITIDPSDGEEGPGRRMLAYALLADIREKRGDSKEAETMRGAVTAIRHSEEADRFYEAGLITRAVKMYQEALSHFADAYCIQSRLALRMAELGDMAGAEEHYRRAYELMPDSFGRVESHCFGCERAFDGEKAQSIAEKVFTELAAKRPDKPQVHYLLGYLRKAEQRYPEALPEFRQAVKLDPEYLNAWKELGELGEKIHLPAREREDMQFTVLHLDPLGHHSTFQINDVIDLKKAWKALDEAEKNRPQRPEALFPLTASAEELRKREQTKTPQSNYRIYMSTDSSSPRTPGDVFARHHVMEAMIQWFNYSLRNR